MDYSPENCHLSINSDVIENLKSDDVYIMNLKPSYSIDVWFNDGTFKNFDLSEDEYNRIKKEIYS